MNIYSEYELFGNDKDYSGNWKNIINTLNNLNVSSLLNIGIGSIDGSDARRWNYFLTNECSSITKVTNLEINLEYCNNIKNSKDKLLNNVVWGDVRFSDLKILDSDLIFWSHGPEHIFREEWEDTFKKLENSANKIVILQMPWGSGYDFMPEHTAKDIKKGEIENYGYECYYQGIEHTRNASLVGIKIK